MFSCKNLFLNLSRIKNLVITTLLIYNLMKMSQPEDYGVNFKRKKLNHLKNSIQKEDQHQAHRNYNLLKKELKIKIYRMLRMSLRS